MEVLNEVNYRALLSLDPIDIDAKIPGSIKSIRSLYWFLISTFCINLSFTIILLFDHFVFHGFLINRIRSGIVRLVQRFGRKYTKTKRTSPTFVGPEQLEPGSSAYINTPGLVLIPLADLEFKTGPSAPVKQ